MSHAPAGPHQLRSTVVDAVAAPALALEIRGDVVHVHAANAAARAAFEIAATTTYPVPAAVILPPPLFDAILGGTQGQLPSGELVLREASWPGDKQGGWRVALAQGAGGWLALCQRFTGPSELTSPADAGRQREAPGLSTRALLEEATLNVLLVDVDRGTVVYANRAFEQLLQAEPASLKGVSFFSLLMPDSQVDAMVHRESVLRGARPVREFQRHLRRADGSGIWGHAFTSWYEDPQSGKKYSLALYFPIDEHVALSRALGYSRERIDSILEVLPVPVAVARISDGAIMAVNETCCRLFEVGREQAKQRRTGDFYADPKERNVLVERLMTDKKVVDYPLRTMTADGRRLDILASAFLIDYGGEFASFITFHVQPGSTSAPTRG